MSLSYSKSIIVIVSAFSSGGARLPQLFAGRGYDCIHITTRREWEMKWVHHYFNEKHFIQNFILEDDSDLVTLLAGLKQYQIKALLPGCESGVILADKLLQYLELPKNDFSLLMARRNKYLMIEAIKKRGLSHIEQCKSDKLNDILEWYAKKKRERVVLKPLSSASSDGVFYCNNPDELTSAFAAIINTKDVFGDSNKEVLVQEFIPGDEYIINTVSCDGIHHIVDVWKGVSNNTSLVSNDIYAELVHATSDAHASLARYVKNVLDALGIVNGAAHSEVRLTPNGPCLIEVGARLSGKVDFAVIETIFGCSPLSLSCEAALEPDVFKQRVIKFPAKYARYVYFFNDREGLIKRDPDLSILYAIESVASVFFAFKKDEILKPTSKAFKIKRPGYAYLVADSNEQLEQDYLALRAAEQQLYSAIFSD
jgi:hypothetical protein